MRFFDTAVTVFSLLAPAASAVNSGKDQFHYRPRGTIMGPSMWIFGDSGLKVFSPDGGMQIKSSSANEICHNVTGYAPEAVQSCDFYDVVSDGKKYVWASVSRGVSKIDVFDIDSGSTVGSFETCANPSDLEYHPLRDEMWVRCRNARDQDGGYMEVLSASSPTGDTLSKVMVTDNYVLSAWGYSVIDNSLGDIGYTTVWNQNKLYKVDLSERKVIDTIDIPLAYGSYQVAYSRRNQHIFLRATVCCTCGFIGADLGQDCGRYGSEMVTLTTGPFAGQQRQGQCGRCSGVEGVDTLGVYELNTATDKFVGNHLMPNGVGGDPFPSPDGRHIIMVGHDGGQYLRILKAGRNGEKSTVSFDVNLGFKTTVDVERDTVFNDFAFVNSRGFDDGMRRDMIVVAAGTENKIAIINILDGGAPTVTTLNLTPQEQELSASRNKREVEWVTGTPFVWVDGDQAGEVYVVNVDTMEVVNTLRGIRTTKMVAVENFANKHIMSLVSRQLVNGVVLSKDGSNFYLSAPKKALDPFTVSIISLVGLVVGGLALIVGVVNIIMIRKRPVGKSMKLPFEIGKGNDDDSIAVESLGSKNVL